MKNSLWVKLLICYIGSAIVVFLILNTYGINRLNHILLDEKKSELYNEAVSISSEYMSSFYQEELSFDTYLTAQLKTLANLLHARIWIVNKNGLVISDTDPLDDSEQIDILKTDPDFLDEVFSDHTEMKGVLSEPMVSVVYRVNYKYQTRGYIVLLSSLSGIKEKSTYFIDIMNLCFLLFLAFLALIFFYLNYSTVIPLIKLKKAATEYSAGNYTYELKMKQSDEYGDLANAISYMASEINSLGEYQRKFVANISHDFRSPLTSIKGYAEALQDGTIPYEMKDKYLGIILFETNRLTKLTTSLLELNSFDNKGTLLDITSFDINHIIKKTAESFEGTCTQKKITLNLIFASKETMVDADFGKIQQVLYNLLDNAIKFSHHNSSIKVTTTEKGDKLFVSIKDNGIGIPKDSIKKIWERFYKTDASRGKDKKGTGLGLSIVKEIITSHNENINVISTEGVGTEFIFSLPRTERFLI